MLCKHNACWTARDHISFHAESAIEAIQRLKSFGIEERVLASIDAL